MHSQSFGRNFHGYTQSTSQRGYISAHLSNQSQPDIPSRHQYPAQPKAPTHLHQAHHHGDEEDEGWGSDFDDEFDDCGEPDDYMIPENDPAPPPVPSYKGSGRPTNNHNHFSNASSHGLPPAPPSRPQRKPPQTLPQASYPQPDAAPPAPPRPGISKTRSVPKPPVSPSMPGPPASQAPMPPTRGIKQMQQVTQRAEVDSDGDNTDDDYLNPDNEFYEDPDPESINPPSIPSPAKPRQSNLPSGNWSKPLPATPSRLPQPPRQPSPVRRQPSPVRGHPSPARRQPSPVPPPQTPEQEEEFYDIPDQEEEAIPPPVVMRSKDTAQVKPVENGIKPPPRETPRPKPKPIAKKESNQDMTECIREMQNIKLRPTNVAKPPKPVVTPRENHASPTQSTVNQMQSSMQDIRRKLEESGVGGRAPETHGSHNNESNISSESGSASGEISVPPRPAAYSHNNAHPTPPLLPSYPGRQPEHKRESGVPKPVNKVQVPVPLPPVPTAPIPSSRTLPAPPQDQEEASLYDHGWYFSTMERKESESILRNTGKDGAFMVRKSTKGDASLPYSLSVWYNNTCWNLHIRLRPDNRYALGSAKDKELTFRSVYELIKHHENNPITLQGRKGSGSTCLTVSPQK